MDQNPNTPSHPMPVGRVAFNPAAKERAKAAALAEQPVLEALERRDRAIRYSDPTVVRYGVWLHEVERFLDDLATTAATTPEGRRAAALLERRAQLNLLDDKRR